MAKITSLFLIALFQLLSLLPMRLLRWLGRLVGNLLWLFNGRSRRITEENLAACFPDMRVAQRADLTKHSLQNLGITILELGPIWCSPVDKLLTKVSQVSGEHYLQQGLADGNGVIILAPHIGAWELLGLYIAKRYPLTTLYQPPDNPAIHDLIVKVRTRNSSGLAPANTKGVKMLLQRLKRGEVIAILPDQVPPQEGGDFAAFFGIPALTTTLVKNLAQRTGAKVIIGCALRAPRNGNFELIFDALSEDMATADTLTSLTVMNKKIQDCVMKAPEQYQWEYKRFKKQPGGECKYYQK
ncbi:MAG: lysophospholipid acyltransferase family protein [Pseudomonadales bacterium]